MATPINELSSNNEEIEPIESMIADDCNSQLVNEILHELNTDEINLDTSTNNYAQFTDNNEQLNRQLDPNVNMNIDDIANLDNIDDSPNREIIDVKINLSTKDKLIEKIKQPLIVILIVFLINSPIINSILVKYLPKLFSSGVSKGVQWLSIFLKAVITGVIFFVIMTIL